MPKPYVNINYKNNPATVFLIDRQRVITYVIVRETKCFYYTDAGLKLNKWFIDQYSFKTHRLALDKLLVDLTHELDKHKRSVLYYEGRITETKMELKGD